MNISKAIQSAYQKALERKWDKIYWAIDIHETILEPSYSSDIGNLYPWAARTLEAIMSVPESRIILWSSLSPTEMKRYRNRIFEEVGWGQEHLYRVFMNENPEVEDTQYASFNQKFYFNILLDDKAGFDPTTDWEEVLRAFMKYGKPL